MSRATKNGSEPNTGDAEGAGRGDWLRIRGARTHNLKNIDLDLPRNQLVVITGPSGSGKSSLAFDTIYAEGQRQYIESLSVFSRQFLEQMQRPDVDTIEGLQPTVCIDQRPGIANPRSTVATITELYDHLRLLFARLGAASCLSCGRSIQQQTGEQIVAALRNWPDGTKVMLMAPLVRGRKGEHREVLAQIRKAGFVRVRIDGGLYDLENLPELAPRKNHDIEAIVDRVIIRHGQGTRLTESVPLALKHGEGVLIASRLENSEQPNDPQSWTDYLFSTKFACPACQINYAELEPRTFSFNSPYGACPVCEGLGAREEFDPDLVLPSEELSLAQGMVAAWRGEAPAKADGHREELMPFLTRARLDWETPLAQWSSEAREVFLRGDDKQFPGLLMMLERELATTTNTARKEELTALRGEVTCTGCQGSRLRKEAQCVRIGGQTIHEVTKRSVAEARDFLRGLAFPESQAPIARPLLSELLKRLDFLCKVGVDYLTLERPTDTLSGGELQRVRLARSIGSGLVGACYVLDEPSIGLHPRDNQRLLSALRELQQLGNTVLVVEHDEAAIRAADYLVDIGPGAGDEGGQVTAVGLPREVAANPASPTGRYLSGATSIAAPARRRRVARSRSLILEGATANNLKNLTVHFPLEALVCVTGVSGSGKSSLVNETLARALVRRLGGMAPKPGPHTSLRGVNQIERVVVIDQAPIGRSPRSNPATYCGLFDEIRKAFAQTREAKQRGYGVGRFSFNVKGGRCEQCQGQGLTQIEMNYLPDLYVPCSACRGARFNRQTLAITYRGRSIAQVLELRVAEALSFFENFPVMVRLLESLRDVGLGYLPLGQASTTLSGGEAQRVKLATELARAEAGRTLYLLDEPTTGLHFDDVRLLLAVLNRLVDRGQSVLVIEHHLDVIKAADWLIDLGPEGGAAGGHLLAAGPPEEIAQLPENATGAALQGALTRTIGASNEN